MILHKEDFDAIRDLVKEEVKKALLEGKQAAVVNPEPAATKTKEKK